MVRLFYDADPPRLQLIVQRPQGPEGVGQTVTWKLDGRQDVPALLREVAAAVEGLVELVEHPGEIP